MKLETGVTLTGKVVRKTDFGIFLGFNKQPKEGLVHISRLRGNSLDLRRQRLNDIALGDEMVVEISEIKKEGKTTKIAASEKLVHDDIVFNLMPLDEPLEGTVVRSTKYGVFVHIPSWYMTGLLHVSNLTGMRWQRDKRHALLQPGDKLTVYVLEVERSEAELKIMLSENPSSAAEK